MNKLSKIGIRGYRSIQKVNLRLGNVTVVIGPSDSGKSNVVRCLHDWAFNATGSSFISHGSDTVRVAAVVDGYTVVWEKSRKGQNHPSRYVVVPPVGEAASYEKVGRNVPPEVQAITGFREVRLDKDLLTKIQIADQDDSRFLVSPDWTPGKVAKVIGKVSGVDAMILAKRDLVQKRRSLQAAIKVETERMEEAEESLSSLLWVDQARNDLDHAEECDRALQATRRSFSAADGILSRLRRVRGQQAVLASRAEALDDLREVLEDSEWEELLEALERAEEIALSLGDTQEEIDALDDRRKELQEDLRNAARSLKSKAKAGSATCPLCDEPAHEGCLEGLARDAEEAAGE